MDARKPEIGSWVKAWGYRFKWTEEHLTAEDLRPLIFTYDELATKCLDCFDDRKTLPLRVKRSPDDGHSPCQHTESPDLYELLRQRAPEDETLGALWDQVNTVPSWVDWDQIARGQKVFHRYAGPSIVGLLFVSLLGGLGSPRVVETLTRTGGFGPCVARRRLLETFHHILDLTDSLPSLQPGPEAKGFASTIRVRLLHASVRRRILSLAHSQPSYYPIAHHGIPINDLDSIATILAFSATLIWIALPRQGIYLRPREIDDYLALWRYTAHPLGVPTHPFSSPHTAKIWMESLLLTELSPSQTSRTLAHNLLHSLSSQPPIYASLPLLRAETHWLLGNDLASALGVPKPRLRDTLLVAAQCVFFMGLCYARRSVKSWDERGVARARRVMRGVAVRMNGGVEARHGFVYVPSLERGVTPWVASTTGTEGGGKVRSKRGGVFWRVGIGDTRLERVCLVVVLVAMVVVCLVGWLGVRGAVGVLQILQ